jgi:hypothetical protein
LVVVGGAAGVGDGDAVGVIRVRVGDLATGIGEKARVAVAVAAVGTVGPCAADILALGEDGQTVTYSRTAFKVPPEDCSSSTTWL